MFTEVADCFIPRFLLTDIGRNLELIQNFSTFVQLAIIVENEICDADCVVMETMQMWWEIMLWK